MRTRRSALSEQLLIKLELTHVRNCPNNPKHRVFGSSKTEWFCAECGLEWKATRKGIEFSVIEEEGNLFPLDVVPLQQYLPEY